MDCLGGFVEDLSEAVDRSAQTKTPMELKSWFYWFSFDFACTLLFSEPLKMLTSSKSHGLVALLRRAMALMGPLTPLPWAATIGFTFFTWIEAVQNFSDMRTWIKTQMRARLKASLPLDVSSMPYNN